MSEADSDDWRLVWDARQQALEAVLGPPTERVFHAVIPLDLGGSADVLEFRKHVPGSTYVTADLVGPLSGQPQNTLGQYELMICTREPEDWAPNLISRLARYTLEAVLEPSETMDMAPALPEGSAISAFLFTQPQLVSNELHVLGQRCGLLLCLGITTPELQACFEGRSSELLAALKSAGVFPYSDLRRKSVLRGRRRRRPT
jgi:hypothetical protein